tara:strand:- start:291 stop:518 length:228 start_codon:yes stop_codon:yes gene_type:complete
VNLEFKEIEFDWPNDLNVYELKNFILSKLNQHGKPLRWAITSLTTRSEKKIQIISIEAVLMVNENNGKYINAELN